MGLCPEVKGWDEKVLRAFLAVNMTASACSALNELFFEDLFDFKFVAVYFRRTLDACLEDNHLMAESNWKTRKKVRAIVERRPRVSFASVDL